MAETTQTAIGQGDPFRLTSLTKATPPSGAGSANWFRYVISQGANTIVGHRQGSQAAVQREVREIVERLNERRRGKSGRVHLTSSRRKKS